MSEVTDAVETQPGDDLLAELSEEFLRRYNVDAPRAVSG
jgi:hypothetical protein